MNQGSHCLSRQNQNRTNPFQPIPWLAHSLEFYAFCYDETHLYLLLSNHHCIFIFKSADLLFKLILCCLWRMLCHLFQLFYLFVFCLSHLSRLSLKHGNWDRERENTLLLNGESVLLNGKNKGRQQCQGASCCDSLGFKAGTFSKAFIFCPSTRFSLCHLI